MGPHQRMYLSGVRNTLSGFAVSERGSTSSLASNDLLCEGRFYKGVIPGAGILAGLVQKGKTERA